MNIGAPKVTNACSALQKKKMYCSCVTCFAGHSHHALLLLPKADIIFKRQEVEQELRRTTMFKCIAVKTATLLSTA